MIDAELLKLINELIQGARGNAVPVSSLLADALFVAEQLELSEDAALFWCERNGYGDKEKTPSYRKVLIVYKTRFGIIMPLAPILEEAHLEKPVFRHSVAELEAMVKKNEPIRIVFLKEQARSILELIEAKHGAWLRPPQFECSPAEIESILHKIRNHLFEWAHKLRAQAKPPTPSAGSNKDKLRIEATKEACEQVRKEIVQEVDQGVSPEGHMFLVNGVAKTNQGRFKQAVSAILGEKPHRDTLRDEWKKVPKELVHNGRPPDQ